MGLAVEEAAQNEQGQDHGNVRHIQKNLKNKGHTLELAYTCKD